MQLQQLAQFKEHFDKCDEEERAKEKEKWSARRKEQEEKDEQLERMRKEVAEMVRVKDDSSGCMISA